MSFGISTAAWLAIASLVYSVASSVDAMRRQKHMQRDAEKRADEAKGHVRSLRSLIE